MSRRRLGYLYCRLGDACAARYLGSPAQRNVVPEHYVKAEEAYRKAYQPGGELGAEFGGWETQGEWPAE